MLVESIDMPDMSEHDFNGFVLGCAEGRWREYTIAFVEYARAMYNIVKAIGDRYGAEAPTFDDLHECLGFSVAIEAPAKIWVNIMVIDAEECDGEDGGSFKIEVGAENGNKLVARFGQSTMACHHWMKITRIWKVSFCRWYAPVGDNSKSRR